MGTRFRGTTKDLINCNSKIMVQQFDHVGKASLDK